MSSHEGLSLEVVKDHFYTFFKLKFNLFIAPKFCNLSFYYKLDEVPDVTHGILKIDLKQKLIIYLAYITKNFLTNIQPIWSSHLAMAIANTKMNEELYYIGYDWTLTFFHNRNFYKS